MEALQVTIREREIVLWMARGEPALGPVVHRIVEAACTAAQREDASLYMGLSYGC